MSIVVRSDSGLLYSISRSIMEDKPSVSDMRTEVDELQQVIVTMPSTVPLQPGETESSCSDLLIGCRKYLPVVLIPIFIVGILVLI